MRHTPSLSYTIQATYPSSSITKTDLLSPKLQPQFKPYSRHKLAFPSIQTMKQINGHALTIPAKSGASQILFTMSLMILTLFPLTLLSDSSKLSQQNVDPTVFTMPGPYHILKMPSKSQLSRSTQPFFILLATTQSPRVSIHKQNTRDSS